MESGWRYDRRMPLMIYTVSMVGKYVQGEM
jgi:hypothetical protein